MRRLVELVSLSQFMVYDNMKLLLFPTFFFSDRVWGLFDIENKLSLKIKKKRENPPQKNQHIDESNVKTIKREKFVKHY